MTTDVWSAHVGATCAAAASSHHRSAFPGLVLQPEIVTLLVRLMWRAGGTADGRLSAQQATGAAPGRRGPSGHRPVARCVVSGDAWVGTRDKPKRRGIGQMRLRDRQPWASQLRDEWP